MSIAQQPIPIYQTPTYLKGRKSCFELEHPGTHGIEKKAKRNIGRGH